MMNNQGRDVHPGKHNKWSIDLFENEMPSPVKRHCLEFAEINIFSNTLFATKILNEMREVSRYIVLSMDTIERIKYRVFYIFNRDDDKQNIF